MAVAAGRLRLRLVCAALLCAAGLGAGGGAAAGAGDYGVKLCGREFIRAVIFTCGGSRWKRLSLQGAAPLPGPEPGISIHATAFFLLKKKLGASLGPAFALDWQHENRVPFHENLNEIKIRPESLVCPYSTQTTNNREPENLKLQSVFVPDLEQLQRESLPLEQQAGKDLFNLYDYNEYVPTSDDFKEYVRQVEDAAQKNKGGTGIASPMGSNSSPWAKYPRKKRDLSMGVAGMCCKWGCTKMEISTLC